MSGQTSGSGGGTITNSPGNTSVSQSQTAQLQNVISQLSSGKCTQQYTQTLQEWLRKYQQTRQAWAVAFLFMKNPQQCKSQTELFFHAQTLHIKSTQLGIGAENVFDAAGQRQLKTTLYEVGCCWWWRKVSLPLLAIVPHSFLFLRFNPSHLLFSDVLHTDWPSSHSKQTCLQTSGPCCRGFYDSVRTLGRCQLREPVHCCV